MKITHIKNASGSFVINPEKIWVENETKEQNKHCPSLPTNVTDSQGLPVAHASPSLRRLQANESKAGSMRLTRFEERVITDP